MFLLKVYCLIYFCITVDENCFERAFSDGRIACFEIICEHLKTITYNASWLEAAIKNNQFETIEYLLYL